VGSNVKGMYEDRIQSGNSTSCEDVAGEFVYCKRKGGEVYGQNESKKKEDSS